MTNFDYSTSARGRSRRAAFLATSALATVLLTASGAQADVLNWTGAISSDWDKATANWDNQTNPGDNTFDNNDDVVFGAGAATQTVNIPSGAVRPDRITFDVDGYVISSGAGGRISSGATAEDPSDTDQFEITLNADATISADINSIGGNATTAEVRTIGTGTLTYSGNGAAIDLFIVGAGTTLINDGDVGNGVATGGTITVLGTLDNNNNAGTVVLGATGDATMEGTLTGDLTNTAGGTIDLTGALDVDGTYANSDTLAVDNDLTVGRFSNTGDVTVESASTLTIDDTRFINNNGGTLTIDDGGTVDGDIRNAVGGTMTIAGGVTGDIAANEDITIEDSADVDGLLNVASGVTASVEGGATLGSVSNSGTIDITAAGTVAVDGAGGLDNGATITNTSGAASIIDVTNNVELGSGSVLTAGAGLTITGAGIVIDGGDYTAGGASYSGPLELDGPVTLSNADMDLGGAATLTVTGDITVGTGGAELNILAGATAQTIDNQSGTVDIDGGTVAAVTSASTTTIDGMTVTGDLTVTDGTTAIGATGGVGGTTNVSGGTVNNAGTIAGANVSGTGTLNTSGTAGAVTVTGATASLTTTGDTGAVTNDGGTVAINDGTVDSLDHNTGTTTIAASGEVEGTSAVSGGTVTNAGTMTGAVSVDGGQLITTGTVTGSLTNSTGDVDIDGGTVGSLVHNGSGTTDIANGAEVQGTSQVSDGVVTNDGTMTGNVTVTGGQLVATANSDINGALSNTDGDVDINGGTVASLAQTSTGTADIAAGATVTGTTTVSDGTVTNLGTLQGDATVTGGVLATSGTAGNIDNDGGQVDITGGDVATLDNNTGTANLDAGDVTGDVTNADIFNFNGGTIGGSFDSTGGTVTVTDTTAVTGTFGNGAGSTLAINSDLTTGGLTNDGTASMADTSSVTGTFTNTGTLTADGAVTIDTLTSTGTVDLADGATDDTVTVTAGASLADVELDVDLSGGGSDAIGVTGDLSGNVDLTFANVGGTGSVDIDVLTYTAGAGPTSLTSNISDFSGAFSYALNNDTANNTVTISGTPAGAGLAAGVTLTQSLIGAIVNRPSSPYVAAVFGAEDDPCGAGSWGRVVAGNADTSGTIAFSGGNGFDLPGSVSADYAGIQIGGDFGCYGGFYNGWDLTYGGFLGVNQGSTSQDVRDFSISGGVAELGAVTSTTKTDFTQTYVGGYLTAASQDGWFGDVQLRFESTEFDASNDDINLDDAFDTSATTLSGSFGRAFQINQEMGISATALAGFAYTETDGTSVLFSDGVTDDGTLEINSSTTEIAFISGSISRAEFLPDQVSRIVYFGTATVYTDFADATQFTFVETGGNETDGESSNLGTYGEVSVGLNYTRLLQPGDFGSSRQFDASVRVDGRFSEDVESLGLTAQARLQF